MMRLAFLVCLVVPAVALAKPKVALSPIDGDSSGDVLDAVSDALDAGELALIGPQQFKRALDKLGLDAGDYSDKELRKLSSELEADAVIWGSLASKGSNKVLHFKLYSHGKKQKGFKVEFASAKSEKFKQMLHDKMLEKLGVQKKSGDDDDADAKPAKKKKKGGDDDEADAKPSKKKKGGGEDDEADAKPMKKKKGGDDEDAKPMKKKKGGDDDEADAKPSKKKKGGDEDEADAKPAKKKKGGDEDADADSKAAKKKGGDDDTADADDDAKAKKKASGEDDSAGGGDDDTPKKAKKKTASADDDEGGDEIHGSADVGAAATGTVANRAAIKIAIGASATSRKLTFNSSTALIQAMEAPPGYSNTPVPGARLDLAVYPFAFNGGKGALAGLGFEVLYDKTLLLSLKNSMAPGMTFPANEQHYELGGRYRLLFGSSPQAASLTFGLDFGHRMFKITRPAPPLTIDVPDVDYSGITPSATFRLPLAPSFALFATGGSLLATGAGQIQQNDQYGRAKLTEVQGSVGMDILIGQHYVITVEGEFAQFGYVFTGSGQMAINRDMDGGGLDVGGAADRYLGGAATFGYLY